MTNCTVVAPVRATKTPARTKAAPLPTPEPVEQATTEAPISADEKTVAAAAAAQLQSIYDTHWKDLGVYASSLLTTAIRGLGAIQDYQGEVDRGDVFHHAAAAVSGALALTRAAQPEGTAIGPMETAFQLLETADIGYGFEQEPCEALAAGIRTGARQVNEAPAQGYTPAQLLMVLEFVAGTANTLNNILMMAQTCEEQWECANLVDAAHGLAQHIGTAADQATGNTVIGDFGRWSYGPNFANLGKAGAA